MYADALYDLVGNRTSPADKVILEVGGDGAIHIGECVGLRREGDTVILTTEQS